MVEEPKVINTFQYKLGRQLLHALLRKYEFVASYFLHFRKHFVAIDLACTIGFHNSPAIEIEILPVGPWSLFWKCIVLSNSHSMTVLVKV